MILDAVLVCRPALPWSRYSGNGLSHATSLSLLPSSCLALFPLNNPSFGRGNGLPVSYKGLPSCQLISPDHTRYVIIITVTLRPVKFETRHRAVTLLLAQRT